MTREQVLEKASTVLGRIYEDNKDCGLQSIYLWGSIITSDFNPETSDIDAVGILSDDADFKEFNKMREWLPKLEPRLKRLQINFFYLSELQGTAPSRSNLARLQDAEQAVFDFPYWIHVCGKRYQVEDFPSVSPRKALKHQIKLAVARKKWAENPNDYYGPISLQYFCKALVWFCYNINKLSASPGTFSWKELKTQSTEDDIELVNKLIELKSSGWNENKIKTELPFLIERLENLAEKYS